MWFDWLQLARGLGEVAEVKVRVKRADGQGDEMRTIMERQFVVSDFEASTGLSNKDASAWLSKFVRWGYARRVGYRENEGKKPLTIYALTSYGETIAPKALNRFSKLLEAVLKFKGASDSEASAAMNELFRMAEKMSERKVRIARGAKVVTKRKRNKRGNQEESV